MPVLSLYRQSSDGWIVDGDKLNFYLDLIRKLDRPVVVYLLANHFSPDSPLANWLLDNPANLMRLPNGHIPVSKYFSTSIKPFTLTTDETLPVNHYRFDAIRKITTSLRVLDAEVPGRIVAITLGGELHQLFDDLMGRTGDYTDGGYTDYSPASVKNFQRWLEAKFKTIDDLNKVAGTPFRKWENIRPPGRDIRNEKLDGFWEHFDAYAPAPGEMPIYGWIDPATGVSSIKIKVDGELLGNVKLTINRLDVYEARPNIKTPNTGFRYDLDFRRMKPGIHTLERSKSKHFW